MIANSWLVPDGCWVFPCRSGLTRGWQFFHQVEAYFWTRWLTLLLKLSISKWMLAVIQEIFDIPTYLAWSFLSINWFSKHATAGAGCTRALAGIHNVDLIPQWHGCHGKVSQVRPRLRVVVVTPVNVYDIGLFQIALHDQVISSEGFTKGQAR